MGRVGVWFQRMKVWNCSQEPRRVMASVEQGLYSLSPQEPESTGFRANDRQASRAASRRVFTLIRKRFSLAAPYIQAMPWGSSRRFSTACTCP